MDRNTITTLGELRVGDRYRYPKRVDVWQVMEKMSSHTSVNQVAENGKRIHLYDVMKKNANPVRFLRHTLPQHGEECLINDLKPGDIFNSNDNILIDWVVDDVKYPEVYATAINRNELKEVFSWMDWVVYVGKKQEVSK